MHTERWGATTVGTTDAEPHTMDHDTKALLVRRSLLSTEQIVDATRVAHDGDSTWLEELLLTGALDEQRLYACISDETHLPLCPLEQLAGLRREALESLPTEVATEHRVLPLAVERNGSLRVAMVDPLDSAALQEVHFFSGRPLVPAIALASSIAWALHHYFGVALVTWPRSSRPSSPRPADLG